MNCTICKRTYKDIKISFKFAGKLKYASSNMLTVLFYSTAILVLLFNDVFILQRGIEFHFKRVNQIDQQLTRIKSELHRAGTYSELDQLIENTLLLWIDLYGKGQKLLKLFDPFNLESEYAYISQPIVEHTNEETVNHLSRFVHQIKLSIIKLLNKLLLTILKLARVILYTDKSKLILLINFTLLTTLYLFNDICQFFTVVIFIYYFYTRQNLHFKIWKSKNAELVIDFVTKSGGWVEWECFHWRVLIKNVLIIECLLV